MSSNTVLEADDFVKGLQGIGFDFFTGVPDTILGGIIAHLTEERLYTPAVREDEAVAMAVEYATGWLWRFAVGCLVRIN